MRSGRLDRTAAARALETIERNTRAQTKIIGDLLDVSGILAGKLRVEPRRMDLVAAVEAAVQSARATAEARNIRVTGDIERAAMTLHGDPDRLDQVLGNLLSNALKFTPAGGRVDVRLVRRAREAQLTVTDSGIGIAPEVLPHIFDRFRQADSSTTRAHGGLGLGLALVRYLVEAHGGSVRAESGGPGHGATFTVVLPLSTASADTPPAREPVALPGLAAARVLVVDDDTDTREFLAYALESFGVKVLVARSATEALAALDGDACHLVVSDLSMPGADGIALVRRLRELDGAAGRYRPAVALTAHARPDDRRRALEAGFDAYLVKPVDARDLVSVVSRLLQRS
jgi:CheY-like chemotaxis protein